MAQLTDAQIKLFQDANFGALATTRADGSAHVSPVWVDWDGGKVVLNSVRGRAKEKHIARDGRVSVAVWSAENPYQYIEVSGPAEVTEEGANEHIDAMAKKYLGQDSYPFHAPGDVRVIVRVTPEIVGGYGWD